MTLYRIDIRYTHKKEGSRIIRVADSLLFFKGLAMEYRHKDSKPARSRLVVEGSWSLVWNDTIGVLIGKESRNGFI